MMEDITNRNTEAFKRAAKAGFDVLHCTTGEWGQFHPGHNWLRISFACDCGREAHVLWRGRPAPRPPMASGLCDAAAILEDTGEFSPVHLKKDGFTDAEIAYAMAHYPPGFFDNRKLRTEERI